MKKQIIHSFLLISALYLTACGPDVRTRENYGNLSSTPGAILLDSQSKHIHGWGRSECLLCHNAVLNIHRRPGASIDVDALNRAALSGGEAKYCLACHGNNGINQ